MGGYPGFRFRPSNYSPILGHSGLDATLCEDSHNPKSPIRSATFRVASSQVVNRKFHDTRSENGFRRASRVVMGYFHLNPHQGDRIHGYSFGGQVLIEDRGDYSICRLESSAPIFELFENPNSPKVFVFSAIEVQLARLHATWGRDDFGFERRMIAVDPFRLFTASLVSLRNYLLPLSHAGEEYRSGLRWVYRAIEILAKDGTWPEPEFTLGGELCYDAGGCLAV